MEHAKQEEIIALTTSMQALLRRVTLETEAGLMTANKYKTDMTAYHSQRIQREILLGNLPAKIRKPTFRNGLYI